MYVGTLLKVPRAYKKVFLDSLTAKDGICEFSLNSLMSLAVRLFYFTVYYFSTLLEKGEVVCKKVTFIFLGGGCHLRLGIYGLTSVRKEICFYKSSAKEGMN